MKIVSIDIGINNLGLVAGILDESYRIQAITDCELIDLTQDCRTKGCHLYHTNTITDRMLHFFRDKSLLLDKADCILIERQIPTSGLCAIQELLFCRYRNKAILMSPNAMHAHFDINFLDYNRRKRATIQLAQFSLSDFKEFVFNEKKDDLADAWCYIKFYSDVKSRDKYNEDVKKEWLRNRPFKSLEEFRYTPEVDSLEKQMESIEIS